MKNLYCNYKVAINCLIVSQVFVVLADRSPDDRKVLTYCVSVLRQMSAHYQVKLLVGPS